MAASESAGAKFGDSTHMIFKMMFLVQAPKSLS